MNFRELCTTFDIMNSIRNEKVDDFDKFLSQTKSYFISIKVVKTMK